VTGVQTCALPILIRHDDVAVVVERESRIVRDFPDVAFGVREIADKAAPEDALTVLQDFAAGFLRGAEHEIDFGFARHVISERNAAEPRSRILDLRILGERLAAVDAENDAACVEKGDAFGILQAARQAHVFIKLRRLREVFDPERYQTQAKGRSLAHAANRSIWSPFIAGLLKRAVVRR